MLTKLPRATVEAMRYALESGSRSAARAALQDLGPRRKPLSVRDHLDETLRWIFRAHDAAERGGVARSYSLRRHRRYECTGWLPAYPETTGYIVPTLYEAGRLLTWPECSERAEQMARWELDVQMESGAVRGGTIADEPSPAVFNTGQVLFGWVRAFKETGDAKFMDAATRAGSFLVDAQDADGCWRRGASQFAEQGGHVYNARAAWGLAVYGIAADDRDARNAARRAGEFALSKGNGRGWFAENCLDDQERPLLHTIAYTAQGLLEMGILLEDDRFVQAARKTALAVADRQHEDGFIAGRFDSHWNEAADFCCVTGNAQMALVWDHLAALERNPVFKEAADRAVRFVLSIQRLRSPDRGVRGGVPGSWPIWGGYGSFEYLNWAAKFLCDALLSRIDGNPNGLDG